MDVETLSALPNTPQACFEFANGRFNQQLFDGLTEAAYRRVLETYPEWPDALNYLGYVLRKQGRIQEALAVFNDALTLEPEHIQARANRSLVLLHLGEYRVGWREYEYRLRHQPELLPRLPWLYWRGESIEGKRILLLGEQGLGDQIQFMRYAPLLADMGAEVELLIAPQLVRLAHGLRGVSKVHAEMKTRPDDYQFQCSLLSLPAVLGTTLESVPARVPYLSVPKKACVRTEKILAAIAGEKLRVGLVWAGSRHQPDDIHARMFDRRRSLALQQLAPLSKIKGVCLFSLQSGEPAAELKQLEAQDWPGWGAPVHDLTADIDDFADTAAWMQRLNLLISCDTSCAHLAGALGRPFWVLNRHDNCWRWLDGRDDSPWYPVARLFRQPKPGDWKSVVKEVSACLSRLRRKSKPKGAAKSAMAK